MTRLKVRAVLDTGSQRSYITSQAARALSLEPEGKQKMSICTFGSEKNNLHSCELVKVLMETTDGAIELQLLTVPVICGPLATQPIPLPVDLYEHLAGLKLADDVSDESAAMEVNLLIGSDYYWELTTGRVKRGESGPVAMETKLGWVLSGPVPGMKQDQLAVSLVSTHTLKVDTNDVSTESNLNDTLRAFWELESLGITASD
ncbi:MAG: hypothetical protein HRO68_10275 [Nitrosopumilus sp.]|nr:hypothetical protein [Nitrosopumilus sp.]